MPTAAACFLLPIGVVLYTMFGGIKATFLTDYIHTVVILVIIIIFSLTVYASSDKLGSPEAVFNLLVTAATNHPVDGNEGGSYLTMRSYEGVIFFVINIVGNFGTVFCDAGYFQKAIAANPASALSGYILGGLCWFAIPWLCATTMGLATIALESNPSFPTYPNRMPDADVSAGLVLPYAAITLLGSGGAAATLLYDTFCLTALTYRLVFMAVTSAMSAELIAVSSLWTYDIYKCYWRPNATGKELIAASHSAVVGFAVIMAGFSTGLYYIGISLGYLYLLMGVIISSAVLPITLILMWKRMNWYAAVFSPILGFAVSVGSWLGTAKSDFGELTVASTGANNPMLVGNVVALLSPIVFVGILTIIKPDNYDFETMKAIELDDDDDQLPPGDEELQAAIPGAHHRLTREELIAESQNLERASFIAKSLAAFLTIALLVLWPMPMYGSGYIFSLHFFTGWVVVGMLWIFFSLFGYKPSLSNLLTSAVSAYSRYGRGDLPLLRQCVLSTGISLAKDVRLLRLEKLIHPRPWRKMSMERRRSPRIRSACRFLPVQILSQRQSCFRVFAARIV